MLSNATVTAAGGFETWDFDSLEGKLNTAWMALDDILLVKAEDGTLRGYHITVIPQVFFSEYVEGDSTYKALEIYNYTGSSIDLQTFGFKIETYSNGASVATDTVDLTGIINSGDVYVVATALVVSTLAPGTVVQEHALMYNGDDAVVLKMGEQIRDRIGQVGVDPGIAWTGGDIDTVSTQNQTLRRKEHITSGDRNAADSFDPSDQWLPFEINTLDGLGTHSIDTEPK